MAIPGLLMHSLKTHLEGIQHTIGSIPGMTIHGPAKISISW